MRRILWLGLLLAVIICARPAAVLAADEPEKDSWTVLIYMCGADLESKDGVLSYCLEEITESDSGIRKIVIYEDWDERSEIVVNNKVHVLMETGGAAVWHSDNRDEYPRLNGMKVSSDKLQRYEKAYDEEGQFGSLELVEELPLASMADPETLGDFIQWGVRKYPAEHYALILTGHGDGSRTGLFFDQLFHDDYMYLDELRSALETGGTVFDVIGIHACMMANLEAAIMIQPYARYLVSSEEYTPAAGLNYKMLLNELYADSSMDGYRLARRFCDTIEEKYSSSFENEQYADMLTYSVVDLHRIPALADAFDDLWENLCDLYETNPGKFAWAMYSVLEAETYGLDNERMRDLGSVLRDADMAACMDEDVWKACTKALEEAVVYLVRGSARGKSSGLSFCYDLSMNADEMNDYARNCPSAPLLALMDAVNEDWHAPDWVYEARETLKPLNTQKAYEFDYTFRADNEGPVLVLEDAARDGYWGLNESQYRLYREDEKTGDIYLIGHDTCRYSIQVHPDGLFTEEYHTDLAGEWPVLEGELCPIMLMKTGKDYELYNTPILLDDKIYKVREVWKYNTRENRVATEHDGTTSYSEITDGEFEFLGVWAGYDSDASHPYHNILPISQFQGRTYQLLYELYDLTRSGKVRYRRGPELTVYRSAEMHQEPLPAGTYYVEFLLDDIFCRTVETELIRMEWDGSRMTVFLDK